MALPKRKTKKVLERMVLQLAERNDKIINYLRSVLFHSLTPEQWIALAILMDVDAPHNDFEKHELIKGLKPK